MFSTLIALFLVTAEAKEKPMPKVWTKEDTIALISVKAKEYKVSGDLVLDIVKCEAGDISSTTIQSNHYYKGKREESYGLSQINLPSHPTISHSQATDPHFAIDFLASNLAKGNGNMWTCYRNIKYGK